MARPIVLSNGELHVGLNNYGLVHDLYYPYVGLENHSSGLSTRHRVGVWINGTLSWLDDEGAWTFRFRYPHKALIGHTIAKNEALGILLEFDDFVDSQMSAFIRNIHVVNLREEEREVRVFTHQAFVIGDSRSNTDTAQYLPDSEAILHYRGRRAMIVSGLHNDKPFDQHSIGLFGIEGKEGTYRDADDGELSNGNGEHGRVDSTLRFKLTIKPLSSERLQYWIAFGTSPREALYIDKQIRNHGVSSRLHQTAEYWKKWLEPAQAVSDKLDPSHRESFLHSMMIIKSHIDKRGAVIASTDSSMLRYSRDDYEYCWPRDGALVLWPLIRMGYTDEPHRFFEFCRKGLHTSGYLMHKYRADGGLGASWHTYLHDGITAPPIQEDETAIVLFVFAQFYETHHDAKLLHEFYESMVKPMASFLAEHIDDTTGLPKPSYDLWEETFLTTTYTTSVVHAALLAAAELAEDAGDDESAVKWRSVADDILVAAHKYLFNTERQSFYKGIIVKNGEVEYNDTIDASSIYGAFMFGLFSTDSDELNAAMKTFVERFKNPDNKIGFPRYENDNYHRADDSITGNWWPIITMWYAQFCLEHGDSDTAMSIINWVKDVSTSTGMIPEQVNPLTGERVSPSPLTWSQAEYVSTLLDTITEHKS
ncbi:glycoside hydrolase family 15 protein [Candidatus Saccharibacteria bacterium]|nr:glycoside hydrolase family 15 protein [Candidatus Saccharibacteria bacterium]